MTLYETLKQAGCQLDNHASDLYVLSTPTAWAIIKAYRQGGGVCSPSSFVSNIDHKLWVEVPFHFDPWWQQRGLTS